MENQENTDTAAEYIEYIDLSSDEDEILSTLEDNQSLLNISEDENESILRNHFQVLEELTFENPNKYWTEEETLRFLFIVDKLGNKWKIIADKYKHCFNNKNRHQLANRCLFAFE